MKNGFKVMDSDMHVIEPAGLWQRGLEPPLRDRAPIGVGDLTMTWGEGRGVLKDGGDLPADTTATPYRGGGAVSKTTGIGKDGWGPGPQVRGMDTEGIDVAILYPTRALYTHAVDGMDPDLAADIGRVYNDWMHGFCQESPQRLHGVGHITPHDMEAAVTETRRCVQELGFKGIFLRPNIVNGRNWYDPYYDPLWAECQRLGVPVGFHEGGRVPYLGRGVTQPGSHFDSAMLQHTCSHPMSQMMAAVSFCGGGILARFPELRVAFLEGNCAWLPWLMWRLDEHQEWMGAEQPDVDMKPSEYFKRQCFVSVECDEWPAKYVEDAGYGHTLVFSTDYPHPDAKYPHATDAFLELDIPEEAKRRYLWDNCARLYGLS